MENASKALIIAGAILISILIISLGVIIYQQAAGVINNNAMSEVEVTQFNEPFLSYTGSNVRGANVNALLNKIQSNNSTYADDDSKRIEVTGTITLSADVNAVPSAKAKTGKTYTVTVANKTKGGLVSIINIVENQ